MVLEQLVLKAIREAAEYITEYEPVFLYLFAKRHQLSVSKNLKQAKRDIEKSKKRIQELDKLFARAEQENIDLRNFLSVIRQCTDIQKLTPELVNRLIAKIEVFNSYKDENGKKRVPVKIHFVGAGVIQPPDAKMIREAQEEIRNAAKSA